MFTSRLDVVIPALQVPPSQLQPSPHSLILLVQGDSSMSKLSRRQLLKLGAAGAAGAMAAPYFIPSGVLAADGKPGANERVAVGAIGVGGRATLLLQQLPEDGQIDRPLRLQRAAGRKVQGRSQGQLADLSELPPDPRTQRHRCGDHRHPGMAASDPQHPRLPGGKRRLRRKAADALHSRRPRAGQCRAETRVASSRSVPNSGRWP